MNMLKRSLAMILTVCMLLSVLPFGALAEEFSLTKATAPAEKTVIEAVTGEAVTEAETEAAVIGGEAEVVDAESSYLYNIVHLDAGRKYFSVDNIKTIIDNAADAGFNQLELYLSDNQGFRFALDDMTLTTSYGTYNLTPALGDGYSDSTGKAPDGTGKYLTQSEMDTIIAYAHSKGIDIVPCINVPGHMGAILEEFTSFKYSGSNSSIDLANAEAVAFALALTEKYADYFASKGCKYYNVGADEYANDLSSMGFEGMGSALYTKFVEFLNDAADIVIAEGMIPRAFNDGFYYKDYNKISVEPNKAYEVCYWSSGWDGYDVAAASTIADKGHKMINTHGDYYWVLGNSSWQCTATKAAQFDETVFQGSTISNPAGSMFCIWCDVGNADGTDGGTAVVSNTASVISAFGGALPEVESLVTITNGPITGAPAAMTVGKTANVSVPENATWTSSNEAVITVSSVTRAVTGTEMVLNAVAPGNATITATADSGNTYTADIQVVAEGETPADYVVELTVGQTSQTYTDNSGYYTTAEGLNTDIATAQFGGTPGSEATVSYQETSVRYDAIATNTSWTKTNYYHLKDGQYYPVYGRYESEWSWSSFSYENTYYVGYKTTDSASDVTAISNSTSGSNTVSVYTKTGTEAVSAQTTVSFTGVGVGTTYATVGSTVYKIVVSKGAVNVNIYVDASVTYNDSSEGYTVADPSIATVTLENGVLTITGKKVGTTYVTTDNAVYTVNVAEEDLSTVTGLTVEFWITNQHVTANNATSMTIAAKDVYGANGVPISTLVPATGTNGGNKMAYWKTTRHASDSKQTLDSGDDKTKSGADFTYIRYYNRSWAYSADGKTWTDVVSGDQIVAYYLQETQVTDEVTTQVSDYGNVPGYGSSLSPFIMVDYAVKYESGEMTPSSFPTENTIAFHCNYNSENDIGKNVIQDGSTYYRRLGTIKAIETSEYEVYMITLTPTSDTKTTQVANNATGATSYTYGGTEKVVWVDDEANLGDFASEDLHYTSPSGNITYTVGGDPDIAGLEVYMNQCMLVTYYVRAKATEDALTVHYIDASEGANNLEFYTYNIAVKEGTTFDTGIALNTSNPNGDLLNGTVENFYGRSQTVSADLSTLSQIGAQYLYSEYNCVKVERSADGKNVYLYYTFDPTVYFVADFGLPISITAADLNEKLTSDLVTDMSFTGVNITAYGKLTDNGSTVIYTPTEIMGGIDYFTLIVDTKSAVSGILDAAASKIAFRVYVVPATTVYYEEGFMFTGEYSSSWTVPDLATKQQTTEVLGDKKNAFGYDAAYSTDATGSNGTYAVTDVVGAKTVFTFTGTGFDLYANCHETSAWVTILCRGETVKMFMVDSKVKAGTTDATTGQTGSFYSLPLVSETGLKHDTYTVEIRMTQSVNAAENAIRTDIRLDGIRIYNTIEDSTVFDSDLEDNPEFYELRDYVLHALSVDGSTTAGQVYATISSDSEAPSAIITNGITDIYPDGDNKDTATPQDLLDNGPKNEVYLYAGQTLTFKVSTERVMQLGLKAPTGATNYTLSYVVDGTTKTVVDKQAMNTSVDMFYALGNDTGTVKEYTVTVTNDGDNILSVTDLKICDDPAAAFVPLTVEDIEYILTGEYPGAEIDPSSPIDPSGPADDPDAPVASEIKRIAGADRFATSYAIADELKAQMGVDKFETVIVAFGGNFPDALTGSYLAAVKEAPILLVMNNTVDALCTYLTENLEEDGKVYILGGETVVPKDTETAIRALGFITERLAGDDRIGTNLEILREAGVGANQELLICTAFNYADSLSAAATGLPMLLVGKTLTEEQKLFLESHNGKLTIIGGKNAVSEELAAELGLSESDRLAGADRYKTSVLLAEHYFGDVNTVLLAYGRDFPDGLCGGALAACLDAPVILTEIANYADCDAYVENVANGYILGGVLRIDDDAARDIFDLASDAVIKD